MFPLSLLSVGYLRWTDPVYDYQTGRKLRASTLFSRLESRMGVFQQYMGFERAIWFKANASGKKKRWVAMSKLQYIP